MTQKRKNKLVVIGNGMAGVRTIEELLSLNADHYDTTVFGSEPHGNYNRIMLSPVLAGEKKFREIVTHPLTWYADNHIHLHTGDPVVSIDRKLRVVTSSSGLQVQYDRLLLATGSKPFILPIPGHDLPGVIAYRDIHDVETMLAAAQHHERAVIIGGGLLGLEAANGLRRQGMDVTVVHVTDSLMDRQLDKPAANLLKKALETRGIRFLLEASTTQIVGKNRVEALRFSDGSEVKADLVVMAVGIRPNIELAQSAGLHCERALVVDDTLQSLSDPRVYAVGECVQHRKSTYGLVAPLYEQAKVCAAHLLGVGHSHYAGSVTSTKLKVTGIDLFSAGNFIGGDDTEDLVFRDPRRGVYKRLVLKASRVVGAVLYGDVADGPWYFDLIQEGRDVSGMRTRLMFGRQFCEALSVPVADVAAETV